MNIFSKLFGKKQAEATEETVRVGGMEDFINTRGKYSEESFCL